MSPQPGNPPAGEEPPPDTRPFLCIPYWTAPLAVGGKWDTGEERPLPAAVLSYACESIHTSAYLPGQPLNVTVNVRNSGGGNSASIATVVVYWADPTVGFAKPTFFAASAVAVPPGRNAPSTVPTPTMTATIPATAPAHICLVVVVSHPQDRAGMACDPINDRHWAQRNLQAVQANTDTPAMLPITAMNAFHATKIFELQIGPADERRARLVANEFGTIPSGIRPRVTILDAEGAAITDSAERVQISLELGPLGRRQLRFMLELDSDLNPGESTAVEAELLDMREHGRLVGSLGLVLLSPDRPLAPGWTCGAWPVDRMANRRQSKLGVLRPATRPVGTTLSHSESAGRMWMRASALLPWLCVATGVGSALGPGLTCYPA